MAAATLVPIFMAMALGLKLINVGQVPLVQVFGISPPRRMCR